MYENYSLNYTYILNKNLIYSDIAMILENVNKINLYFIVAGIIMNVVDLFKFGSNLINAS